MKVYRNTDSSGFSSLLTLPELYKRAKSSECVWQLGDESDFCGKLICFLVDIPECSLLGITAGSMEMLPNAVLCAFCFRVICRRLQLKMVPVCQRRSLKNETKSSFRKGGGRDVGEPYRSQGFSSMASTPLT